MVVFGFGVSYESGRILLFGLNPNNIGVMFVFSIFWKISQYRSSTSLYNKLVIIGSIMLLLFVIIQTGSRTVLVLSFVGMSLFILFKNRLSFSISTFMRVLALFAILGLIVIFIIQSDLLAERVLKTIEEGDISGRDTIWELIYSKLIDSLLFGLGINGYIRLMNSYRGSFFSPHNGYLELLIYGGLPALFFYIKFYYDKLKFLYIKRIGKDRQYLLLFIFLFFGLLVALVGQVLEVKIFWVFIALAVSLVVKSRKVLS
jgi:O-antigen ligase